jgi:hypothetical protein
VNPFLFVKRSDADASGEIAPEDEVEFVVQEEQQESIDQQKILADLAAKDEALKAAQAQADQVAAMRASFDGLGERLAKQPQVVMPQQQQQQPAFDPKRMKEEFNEKIFVDPYETIMGMQQMISQAQASAMANQNLAYSKQLVKLDPETKEHLTRWESEVESVVQALGPQARAMNPNIYRDALDQVRARHMNEIIQEKVAEALKTAAPAAATRPVQYTETSTAAPSALPAGGKRQITISPAIKARAEAEARSKGIPVERMFEIYRDRGLIR